MPAPHPNKEIPLQAETLCIDRVPGFPLWSLCWAQRRSIAMCQVRDFNGLSNALFGELSQVKIKRQHVNLQIIVSGEQSESPPIRLKLGSAGNLEFGFGLGLLNSNLVWDILALTKHDVRC